MRWQGRRESGNVEDRRGRGGRSMAAAGGLGTLVLVVAFILLGGNPQQLLESGLLGGGGGQPAAVSAQDDELKQFVSVRLELQADFLAGFWARRGQEKFQFLEAGDLEEALGAANAIGDDTLQKQTRGYVVPDAFTHGTSEQRMKWFRKGLQARGIDEGDTFGTREL